MHVTLKNNECFRCTDTVEHNNSVQLDHNHDTPGVILAVVARLALSRFGIDRCINRKQGT